MQETTNGHYRELLLIPVDALSFLTLALSLAWIRAPEPSSGGEQPSPRMGRAIAEELRFVFGEPLLRSLTSSVGFVLGAQLAGWLTRRVCIGMTLTIAPLVIGGSDLLIPPGRADPTPRLSSGGTEAIPLDCLFTCENRAISTARARRSR